MRDTTDEAQIEPETAAGAEADDSQEQEEARQARRRGYVPVAEWMAGMLGLALVVGTLGFLLYRAFTAGDAPPQIQIGVEAITQTPNGYLVEILVSNSGEQTASTLQVEGRLMQGSEAVQTSSVTIDYVPSRSSRKAGLFFMRDPREFDLSLRALGYQSP